MKKLEKPSESPTDGRSIWNESHPGF